ncbi:MAG TPA: hypothetical protein VFB58_18195 [Chloroflexota bacterium]|nr:hypothetical protein [Chloroflexota bacterium]
MMPEFDSDIEETAQYIARLAGRVSLDPAHKTQLRGELLRRHQEHSVESSQRATGSLWSRLTGHRRLTLVAPPALGGILVAILLGLSLAPHQSAQAAEAARITDALARSAPTVTAWQVTAQQQEGNAANSVQCELRLSAQQRIYVRNGRAYMYSNGTWYALSATNWATYRGCSGEGQLQIAFALLPERLSRGAFALLPARTLHGQRVEGIRYAASAARRTVTVTLWVDRSSGLVLEATRLVTSGSHVLRRDVVDYSYTRTA